jgi:site-specific recombinase XerD
MEKLTVSTYLELLKSTFADALADHCTMHLSQHPLASDVKKEVQHVIKCMVSLNAFNKAQDRFESEFLRRVIKKFRTEVEVQSLELMILELILLHALNEHQINSAKIPAIIKLHRDKPLIRPDAMLRINAAAKLIGILEREQCRPSVQENLAGIVGRLLLHLFFKQQVEKLEYALRLIQSAPRLAYLDGIVCIELNEPDLHCRCVLSEPGAIWWLHWLSVKDVAPLNPRKKAAYYISVYLQSIPDWQYSSVSLPTLKLLRKTDLALRISPIHYTYVANFFKSASLRQTAFLRILTDKKVRQDSVNPDTHSVMTVRETRNWKEQFSIERYTPVQEQLMELTQMMDLLKPSDGRHHNGRLGVSRNELTHIFTQWLTDNKGTYSPYLWLLMAWAKSLLTDGGQIKSELKSGTIIDYINSIGSEFLTIFCQYKIETLGPDDWIDLLDEVSQEIKSSQRKSLVIYLASYLRDSGLVPDLAVSELDIAASHGQVDANIISPHHIDMIIQYLMKQNGEIYRDAILLLCLCYFSGLRRSEAGYLQLSDFTFSTDLSGPVDMYIRLNVKRGIKSKAARRILPLDVLWPADHLSLLRNKIMYSRQQSVTPTRSLFQDNRKVEKAFLLITDLMHHITGDQTLRIHHLRHSFANWQWFRLNPNALSQGRKQLTLFNHTLFSADQVEKFHARLGLKPASRKSMYVLCHLLGHKEPSSIIASYLHLKDLAGYFFLNARATIQNKQLTQTLGRTKVELRNDYADNLALRLSFETKQMEEKIAPILYGKTLSTSIATLHEFVIRNHLNADTLGRNVFTWAGILMACKTLTPEQVAENEGMHPEDIRRLINTAETIQRKCSGRGKQLPLIPDLTPWVKTLNQKPVKQQNMTEKMKAESHSFKILRFLLTRLNEKLEQGGLTWDVIRNASYNLIYVVPGKGFLIRSPSIKRTQSFFELLQQLGLNAKRLRLTLYLDPNEVAPDQTQHWYNTLKQSPLGPLDYAMGEVGEFKFMKHVYRESGALQIALVNRKLSKEGRRQRVFMSFFQLLAILALFFKEDKPINEMNGPS